MQKFFKFVHSNSEVRKQSSSGGAFTLISDIILSEGGVVYGCAMDEKQNARHVRAANNAERDKMRGSKYIQSDIGDVFLYIEKDLEDGNKVLFSGTPCQCSAIKQYLKLRRVKADNLILLEVICHGVGSKRFFIDYVKHLEKRYNGKAISVNFRAKHHKGQKQDMAVAFDNGKVYHASSTKFDWFYSVYLKNIILRPACYKCLFARETRFADLTIADYWGYHDDEAYSLVICNSVKGWDILGRVHGKMLDEIDKFEVKQPHMLHPCRRPNSRDKFWNIYRNDGYLAVQKWYGNNTVTGYIVDTMARVAYNLHFAGLIKRICKR